MLVGPPGAGKSTVGALLAQRWGLPFVDTDDRVEQAAGRSIADLFVDDGEAAFRVLEREEVRTALGLPEAVVALGGGAVLDPQTRRALQDGGAAGSSAVVFLDVGIADAAPRVGFDTSRPLLAVNPRASWTRLMTQRRPVYLEVATVTVDTAGLTPEEVADAVVRALGPTPAAAGSS